MVSWILLAYVNASAYWFGFTKLFLKSVLIPSLKPASIFTCFVVEHRTILNIKFLFWMVKNAIFLTISNTARAQQRKMMARAFVSYCRATIWLTDWKCPQNHPKSPQSVYPRTHLSHFASRNACLLIWEKKIDCKQSKGLFIWRRVTLQTEPPQAIELFIRFFINSSKPCTWESTKIARGGRVTLGGGSLALKVG